MAGAAHCISETLGMDVRGVKLSEGEHEVQGSCSSKINHFYVLDIVGAEVSICCWSYSPLAFCGCKTGGEATL